MVGVEGVKCVERMYEEHTNRVQADEISSQNRARGD